MTRGWFTRSFARAVHFTGVVDRASAAFDRWRSVLLLQLASDEFFEAYNEVTYTRQGRYDPGSPDFRSELFGWEDRVITELFPPPPAAVLVGGAGGGREAIALAVRGYQVTAFEPVDALVGQMQRLSRAHALEALSGGYGDLPILLNEQSRPVDLRQRPAFTAAILGWASFSHLRTDAAREAALAGVGAVTNGPILVSYFASSRGRRDRIGREWFAVGVGYARETTPEEITTLARRTGLEVVRIDHDGQWPHAVLRSRTTG